LQNQIQTENSYNSYAQTKHFNLKLQAMWFSSPEFYAKFSLS